MNKKSIVNYCIRKVSFEGRTLYCANIIISKKNPLFMNGPEIRKIVKNEEPDIYLIHTIRGNSRLRVGRYGIGCKYKFRNLNYCIVAIKSYDDYPPNEERFREVVLRTRFTLMMQQINKMRGEEDKRDKMVRSKK